MKAIVFAGGVGTRLWPLSRRSSPKQFEEVLGDKYKALIEKFDYMRNMVEVDPLIWTRKRAA